MEASGDSEADSDAVTGQAILTMEEEAVIDEDDTESCTNDPHDNIHADHNNFNNDDGVDDDDEDDANMEHERVITWSPGELTGLEKEGGVDSTEEDRVFWQTCLASGYP